MIPVIFVNVTIIFLLLIKNSKDMNQFIHDKIRMVKDEVLNVQKKEIIFHIGI